MYDIIVIGAGPAGLCAALYGLRQNKKVLVIERATFGGQITYSPKVENIPGFVSLSGNEFAEKFVEQVTVQGGEFEFGDVTGIVDGRIKKVITDSGEYEAKAVIVATGAKHRPLGLENEENFIGNGISFCAVCDGAFFKDKTVAVIGGGNSALQEALELSEQSKKVIIVQNLDFLTGEERLQKQVYERENTEVILGTTVKSIIGENEFGGIVVNKTADNTDSELRLDGMFIAIGLIPQNEPFSDVVVLDKNGYADADESCRTAKDGIFVAGDCRRKNIRQVTTAMADGAVAALAACRYIDNL